MTFNELLKEAVSLDISHQAREQIRIREDIVENVEIAVLRTEAERPSYQHHIANRNDDSCWHCGEWGHIRRDCCQFELAQRDDNRDYNDPNTYQERERHNDRYYHRYDYEDDYEPMAHGSQQREQQKVVNRISELTVTENQQPVVHFENNSEYN
eukprot:sb/3473307/